MMDFIDLKAQQKRIRPELDAALKRVLDHGQYIMGPEVFAVEDQLATYCGVKHVISCANGTDALVLGLMALDVQPGDAIFIPSFTFAATAGAIAMVGAVPVFVDVLPDTYNMDPLSLAVAIQQTHKKGLPPKGVIPVDLFGQPADFEPLAAIASAHHLWIMMDAAQSFGAVYHGARTGSLGQIATTSFFPAKPLGCYGEGGAIFTCDDEIAEKLRSLRVHGQGVDADKYNNVRVGMNGRLETMQAAILLEKLKIFEDELNARQHIAQRYTHALQAHVQVPHLLPDVMSSWAQYTVVLPNGIDRTALQATLASGGIPTMVYYPKGLHQQPAYARYLHVDQHLPVTQSLSARVLSLPFHPYLEESQQHHIINSFMDALLAQTQASHQAVG